MSPAPSTQSHQVQLNIQSANNIGPEAQQALNYFTQADSNSDGWLDFLELHQLLRNHNQTQYEAATVWYLLTTFADKATPDRVNFDQFYTLWQYLAEWHVTFKRLDADGSGMINEVELGRALRSFQQPASPQFVKFLMDRFAPEGASELNFDVFLRVCSSVRTLGEQFKKLDRLPDGRIIATPEQLIQCALLEIVS
ncbi:EF-hand [Ramicandelaber brevisporus]|nr:EF-hand [Ramicandelaber brevisporus]